MSDLIDRGYLAAKLTKAYDSTMFQNDDITLGMREGFRRAISHLASAPRVETPEIVRCCTCMNWRDGNCEFGRINCNPYAYCSYGVRRQE